MDVAMQVRIDDDVIPLLEASKAAHGGSLSKAANRLLRASVGPTYPARVTITSQPISHTSAILPRAHGEAPKRVGRCSHPLLRRVGNACMVCGSTV